MADRRKDLERKKKDVVENLKEGELIAVSERPTGAHGSFWEHLLKIRCLNNQYQPFVQCQICKEILSYSITNGTTTISYHVQNCVDKLDKAKNTPTLDSYLTKSDGVKISANDKRLITIACAKFFSFDIRPFHIVKSPGFVSQCQDLIHIDYHFGIGKLDKPTASTLLPDPTNVSRTISQLSEEYRDKLNQILKADLQMVKLIGVSTDYWKNSGTGDNYLTINIHYSKNEKCITYMLRTVLFDQSNTGENTRKKIFSTLSTFGIDSDKFVIVYVTDNGSNLVCGLKSEVHVRCICHCLNLALHSAVNLCTALDSFIKVCQDLCTHFKRCELNPQLPTIHLVVPWFSKLKKACEANDDDHLVLVQLKKMVSKALDEKVHLTPLHYISTFLHPATEKLGTLGEQCRNEIYTNTRRILEMVGINQHFSQSSSENDDQPGRLKRRKLNLVNEISVIQEYAGEGEENDDMYLDEVDRYKQMKLSFSNNEILLK